jgi:hypothetical protein
MDFLREENLPVFAGCHSLPGIPRNSCPGMRFIHLHFITEGGENEVASLISHIEEIRVLMMPAPA